MEIKTGDIAEAFNEFASGYDLYGDKWQDMGVDEVFAAGYRAALSKLSETVEFTCHGNNAPAYSCNKPGDQSGTYYRVPNELEG